VTARATIPEFRPDFGVTILDAAGVVLATRRLIALNVADRHVGSFAKPFVVNVPNQVVVASS